MRNITRILTLILLVGGLSLNAMNEDAAALSTLQTELQKQTETYNVLQQELQDYTASMAGIKLAQDSDFEWLWEEIDTVSDRTKELRKQIRQKKEVIEKVKSLEATKN